VGGGSIKSKIIIALIAISFCAVGGLMVFGSLVRSLPPMPEALAALSSDEAVTYAEAVLPGSFINSRYDLFVPVGTKPTKGFIIYPGGLVDPWAYAPIARAIASEGFLAVIIHMPFDLAFFGMKRAGLLMSEFESITAWVVGGHSLGGVAACGYAEDYANEIEGVVLWASYPSETFRIEDKNLAVLSIYGTEDGLTTLGKIETSRQHLPAGTRFVAIEGGNHTQFGWYGDNGALQKGDNEAAISHEEQHNQIISATVSFLQGL
jgi:dienelactone hydrolase